MTGENPKAQSRNACNTSTLTRMARQLPNQHESLRCRYITQVELRDDWGHQEVIFEMAVLVFAACCWVIAKRSDAESDDEERRRDFYLWLMGLSIFALVLVIIINYVNIVYFRGVRLVIDTCMCAPPPTSQRWDMYGSQLLCAPKKEVKGETSKGTEEYRAEAGLSCIPDGCLGLMCCVRRKGWHASFQPFRQYTCNPCIAHSAVYMHACQLCALGARTLLSVLRDVSHHPVDAPGPLPAGQPLRRQDCSIRHATNSPKNSRIIPSRGLSLIHISEPTRPY